MQTKLGGISIRLARKTVSTLHKGTEGEALWGGKLGKKICCCPTLQQSFKSSVVCRGARKRPTSLCSEALHSTRPQNAPLPVADSRLAASRSNSVCSWESSKSSHFPPPHRVHKQRQPPNTPTGSCNRHRQAPGSPRAGQLSQRPTRWSTSTTHGGGTASPSQPAEELRSSWQHLESKSPLTRMANLGSREGLGNFWRAGGAEEHGQQAGCPGCWDCCLGKAKEPPTSTPPYTTGGPQKLALVPVRGACSTRQATGKMPNRQHQRHILGDVVQASKSQQTAKQT